MKKTIQSILLVGLVALVLSLTACGESHTHNFSEWTITKEATCNNDGIESRTCSCGETETRSVTGYHSWVHGNVIKEPTCGNYGTQEQTCSLCNETVTFDLDRLGHTADTNGKCIRCGITVLVMNETDINNSKAVDYISYSTYEMGSYIEINITLKDENKYAVQAPAYVDVRIEDEYGTVLLTQTYIKKSSQTSIQIEYDNNFPVGITGNGTLYYRVYSDYDYFTFNEYAEELEDLPWSVPIELPQLPATISRLNYNNSIISSCVIDKITTKVSDDDLIINFNGQKTYDSNGEGQSAQCYIAWKLYDEDGYVINDGTLYTVSVATGEKFKNQEVTVYDCVEKGKSYKLVISNVN